ncbi:hypothetical protein P389DRAFT_5332 [Cystobasidium minutum MCA 4210]|uniref:uncharacterized protein n=1 Tax=Cystobasidium minutum MCA 4210 TaxID=1397322 RepID=UPI0034CE1BD8|eukprot:jgi/Rhomi1/5332/CE5331_2879
MNMSSSSPQTPRDGAALFSSFDTLPASMNFGAGMGKGGQGLNTNTKSAAADFDFDMLAASFLNDQVAAFDSAPAPASYGNNKSTENFFANLPLIGSPLPFATSNLKSSSPPAPLLQNAFGTFSNASNNMVDGSGAQSTTAQQPHLPHRSTSMSSSTSSSVASPNLASPAFDATLGNFPFSFAANTTGNNGLNASYTSPNYSGIDTPALVMDDGNDLATPLTTSPMWGQLDLGSISLFPQQQQQPTQQHVLPTISPKELDLPLPGKTSDLNLNTTFKDQAEPSSSVSTKANKKRLPKRHDAVLLLYLLRVQLPRPYLLHTSMEHDTLQPLLYPWTLPLNLVHIEDQSRRLPREPFQPLLLAR